LLSLSLLFVTQATGMAVAHAAPPPIPADARHSPAPGSAERRAILAALRAEVLRWSQIEVVFEVDEINVVSHWAWVHTRPASRDGQNHYEDISALLKREQGQWRVLALDADAPERLRRRFPTAPEALLESR
jgi:hypothetical protein